MIYVVQTPNGRIVTRHNLYRSLADAKTKADKIHGTVTAGLQGEVVYTAS